MLRVDQDRTGAADRKSFELLDLVGLGLIGL
jgi:hypothetical protein